MCSTLPPSSTRTPRKSYRCSKHLHPNIVNIHLRWTMPDDDKQPNASIPLSTTENAPMLPQRSIWSLPPPVKRIFDKFPLITYEANELPARAPKDRRKHVMHVFTTGHDAKNGRPSFNPGCLKWQVSQMNRKTRYM